MGKRILFSPNGITQHSKGLFPSCQIGNKSNGVDFRNEGEQEQCDPVFEVSVRRKCSVTPTIATHTYGMIQHHQSLATKTREVSGYTKDHRVRVRSNNKNNHPRCSDRGTKKTNNRRRVVKPSIQLSANG